MPKKKKSSSRKKPAHPREAIQVLALIEALESHVLGRNEMTTTQVSAALALLKKTLPDIAAEAARRAAPPEDPAITHEDALSELE